MRSLTLVFLFTYSSAVVFQDNLFDQLSKV